MPGLTSFKGFDFSGECTLIPDVLIGEMLNCDTKAQLRVLSYIIRETLSQDSRSACLSLKQIAQHTKLSKSAVVLGVKALVSRGVISVTRRQSVENGNEPTVYEIPAHLAPQPSPSRGWSVAGIH